MKIQLTKANTFQLEPGKRYLCIISSDVLLAATDEEKDKLKDQFTMMGIKLIVLPTGDKFKVVEGEEK